MTYPTDQGMPKKTTRPTIGLALGSGAARGWAHIGVIRALEEMGVRPDIVTGSSVGAVVAAAYAAGKLDLFERWVTSLDRAGVLRLMDTKISGGGFIQGLALMKAIDKQIGNPDISELGMRFGCVATQFGTGREVWIREGKLLDAVRSSIALPGIFAPVEQDGEYLFDGGLVNPVPVSLTRAMGADIVIASNLNGDLVAHEFFAHDKKALETRSIMPPRDYEIEDEPESEPGIESESSDSFLDRLTERMRLSIALKVDSYISSALKSDEAGPGIADIIIGAIDIMQDRITRARMAGEPPDIHVTPRLRHIGVMDFERAEEAIYEGHAAVERERTELNAIKHALERHELDSPATSHAQEKPATEESD
jgi:NTE family protein